MPPGAGSGRTKLHADVTVPRGEYPRPQFLRDQWLCLNGPWQFEIDQADSGFERGLLERELTGMITAPFPPESSSSGVGCPDFMNAVWYRRRVEIPRQWSGRKVLLHFQAVGTDATVWVNGREVARHRGAWTPFTADLGVVEPGHKAVIVLRARHDTRNGGPYGKQSIAYSGDCPRATGIWQTVWMEPVDELHLKRPRITPDVANRRFRIVQPVSRNRAGLKLRAALFWQGRQLGAAEAPADADFAPSLDLIVPEDRLHLWGPGEGNLYDITLELIDAHGSVVDHARTYAGLRSVTIDGMAVKINGWPVFQRLVLDQGQYLDTGLTAPSDQALKRDIELAMAAGFNGARFHQKVFDERSLYHADRLGYLVWGEFGDWGYTKENPQIDMVTQWLEELQRDYSHPCIVGWCALNESVEEVADEIRPLTDITRCLFLAAKAMDASRPVLDASGHAHRVPETDVWDSHDYDFLSNPAEWAQRHAHLAQGRPHVNAPSWVNKPISIDYRGQPYFLSEFGGLWWAPRNAELDRKHSWGYGQRPRTLHEFLELFRFYCHTLMDDPLKFGYCYTQLTDTGTEQNGIVYQDRTEKLDLSRLREVQSRPAAIETER